MSIPFALSRKNAANKAAPPVAAPDWRDDPRIKAGEELSLEAEIAYATAVEAHRRVRGRLREFAIAIESLRGDALLSNDAKSELRLLREREAQLKAEVEAAAQHAEGRRQEAIQLKSALERVRGIVRAEWVQARRAAYNDHIVKSLPMLRQAAAINATLRTLYGDELCDTRTPATPFGDGQMFQRWLDQAEAYLRDEGALP